MGSYGGKLHEKFLIYFWYLSKRCNGFGNEQKKLQMGGEVNISHKKTGRYDRKRISLDLNQITDISFHKRTTLRSLSMGLSNGRKAKFCSACPCWTKILRGCYWISGFNEFELTYNITWVLKSNGYIGFYNEFESHH